MNPASGEIPDLKLPLTPDRARHLHLGDMATVSGLVFTGRSRLHIRAIAENILPPIDFAAVNAFFHVGPVMRRTDLGWEVVSIEPTSSIRFERYSPELIRRLNLRVLIGKTTMGRGTAAALRDVGGVHLTKIGLCGNQLVSQVKRVVGVHFLEELGKTEATWVFEVERFGPFFVDMDAHGGNYFEQLDAETERNMPGLQSRLGVSRDFVYTSVIPE